MSQAALVGASEWQRVHEIGAAAARDDLREVEQSQSLAVRADEQPVARREGIERVAREVDEHERVLTDDGALCTFGRPVDHSH